MSQLRKPRTRDPLVKTSYQELLSFLRFYRHHGTPVIIGGWAVYFYNPYYGSVDIDVVGASLKGAFEEIIEKYEITHGYEFVRDAFGTESAARKPIFRGRKKIGEMEIDACSYERLNASRFHEDPSKVLPYSLCSRKGCTTEIGLSRDIVCYIPTKALLVLFKVKARRDRSYDIRERGATMNPETLAWLQGKVVKDGSDIIALLDAKPRKGVLHESLDYNQLRRIVEEFSIGAMAKETLGEVLNDRMALQLYGREIDKETILKSLARVQL